VFEGIRIYDGNIFKLDKHMNRFWRSAKYLGIKIPYSKKYLIGIIKKLAKLNKVKNGYCRPYVTGGSAGLGLNPKNAKKASTVVIVNQLKLYPKKEIKVIIAKTRRTPPECINPNIKACNYVNNILAVIEANQANAQEAILLDMQGNVAEGSGDNIFMVKHGKLFTPKPRNILPGITREFIMKIARSMKYKVVEKNIKPHELLTANEIFLTGTGAEIIPVVKVGKKRIGDGKIGQITFKLIEKFNQEVRKPSNGTVITY